MATTRHRGKPKQGSWPKRGEIYLTALDPTIGREIQKTRPALVIQNDITNEHSGTTIVAPITSKVRTPLSPLHVLIAAEENTGLSAPSVALLNQIRTVNRRRLVKRLGRVDAPTMELVNESIEISLGLMSV
jgi:mRNA interferase MazF